MVPLNLGKCVGARSACTPQHALVRLCGSIGRANKPNQILRSKNLPDDDNHDFVKSGLCCPGRCPAQPETKKGLGKKTPNPLVSLAPGVGLEPTTERLTAACSTS